jgi:hypothetical protein
MSVRSGIVHVPTSCTGSSGSQTDEVCCYATHGGVCRCDHQLKQLPGWTLTQPEPGAFIWITPAGRTYTTGADPHLAD